MKVAFIGCVETSYVAFKRLLQHHHQGRIEVVALITKRVSTFNSDFQDLVPLAKESGIKTIYFTNSDDYFLALKGQLVDLIFCVGWSHIIPPAVLDLATKASIGFHPAKLPNNRGRHPLIWALVLGLKETASSFFLMEKEVDSGAIIDQQVLAIADDDYARDLYDKVLQVIPMQVERIIKGYLDGDIKPLIQSHEFANHWRKRTFLDGTIDWRMHAKDIYNLIRALAPPYPGATFIYNDKTYALTRSTCSDVSASLNFEPGKILDKTASSLNVKCAGASSIWIEDIDTSEFEVGEYL